MGEPGTKEILSLDQLEAVTGLRTVPDAWPELRGIRAPGTGVPGAIAVGTRRGGFGKDFVVVHRKGPAVVVELEGEEFERLVAAHTQKSSALFVWHIPARRPSGVPICGVLPKTRSMEFESQSLPSAPIPKDGTARRSPPPGVQQQP